MNDEPDDVEFYHLVVRVNPKRQNAFMAWVVSRGASQAEPRGDHHVEIRWDDDPDLHTDPEALEERGKAEVEAFEARTRFSSVSAR